MRVIFCFCIVLLFACSDKQNNTDFGLDSPYEALSGGEASEDAEYNTFSEDIGNSTLWKIPYTEYSGLVIIPVSVNGMKLDMIFDTGASTTTITLAEAQYLFSKGLMAEDDIIDVEQYGTADGGVSVGLRVLLKKLSIGNNNEIQISNVEATIVENQQAPLLLGQSVFKLFSQVSIDRENKVVVFKYN
ncbi:MAG: retropepsin-like aspartic protease [Bacteroidales bacterium]|nr:retropepsin-like aspartic protease [Bacteroidales bacterium]